MLGKIQNYNRAGINPEDVQPTGEYLLSNSSSYIHPFLFLRFACLA